MSTTPIKNIAFYHFFKPNFNLPQIQGALLTRMKQLGIKGSILLADEGINASLAGESLLMDQFLEYVFTVIRVRATNLKISYSDTIPFKRSLVKVKDAIVAKPGKTPLDIPNDKAPYISPEELDQWIKDGKNMVILDTRNDYEFDAGKFKNSVHLGTKHFADFEEDLSKAPDQWKNTPIVTFCTGGIRCEKAAPLMLKKGFREVYQLDGGILNYFKKVGKSNFEGACFVFDKRTALNEELNPEN